MKHIFLPFIYSSFCLTLYSQAQLTNTGSIKINSGTSISFFGDFVNNGTWVDSGQAVSMSGIVAQSIGGSSVTTFNNLTINNSHAGGVTLSQVANVQGALTLNAGLLHTTSTNIIQLTNAATTTGASNTSFVSGPIRKTGNQAFIFPVGKISSYAPISISAPLINTDQFTAEYFQTNPNPLYNVDSKDPLLDTVSTCEYWILDRTTGTSNVKVTLSWNTWSCTVYDLIDLRVARWNGSIWKDHGNGGTTGDTTAGTIITPEEVTEFSPFTLAQVNTNALAVNLMGINGQCQGKNAVLAWTTATEKNNVSFTVESSQDGKNWLPKTTIPGAGNSSYTLHYSYTDTHLRYGTTYYRLKQTDANGNFSYSDLISLKNCDPNLVPFDLIAYPNPSRGIYNLLLSGDSGQVSGFDVINILGEKIYYSKNHQAVLDLTDKSNGIYFIRYYSDQKTIIKKIIIED